MSHSYEKHFSKNIHSLNRTTEPSIADSAIAPSISVTPIEQVNREL